MNEPTRYAYISHDDMRAAVAIVRAAADDDLDLMAVAMDMVDDPYLVAAFLAHNLVASLKKLHEFGHSPPVDEVIDGYGRSSASAS